MSRFDNLLSTLRHGDRKERIQTALDKSDIANGEDLAEIVAGRNIEQVTSLLQQPPLSLGLYDASALAGLLVAPTGNYASISHLIIPSRFEIVSIIYLISLLLHRA